MVFPQDVFKDTLKVFLLEKIFLTPEDIFFQLTLNVV